MKRILAVLLFTFVFASFAADGWFVLFKPLDLNNKAINVSNLEVALQNWAGASQTKAMKILSQTKAVYKSYWINNSIFVRNVDEKTLEKLEKLPNVVGIYPNIDIKLPKTFDYKEYKPTKSDGEYFWALKLIGADKVHKEYHITGQGVVVGHIDSGVDSMHPDLAGKIMKWKDFTSYPSEDPIDENKHGTHTAGTIAGGNNSGQQIGVAPGVKLICARVFGKWGGTSTQILLNAMEWMLDPDGNPKTKDYPQVINNSWGGPITAAPTFKPAVEAWVKAGIFPVFSAGNSGPRPETVAAPAGLEISYAVGATDKDDKIAYFSSRGPVTLDGKTLIKPDISAPGVDILSSVPGGRWAKLSGTSMAGPMITGCVALLLSYKPDLTIEQIKDLLNNTAIDLGDPGKDNFYGYGRVDIYAAFKALDNNVKFNLNAKKKIIDEANKKKAFAENM